MTRISSLALALFLCLALAACAKPQQSTSRIVIERFDHAGYQWTRWSDGTITNNDGHLGRVDPRLPLCEDTTLTGRSDRLKRGGAYASECRIK